MDILSVFIGIVIGSIGWCVYSIYAAAVMLKSQYKHEEKVAETKLQFEQSAFSEGFSNGYREGAIRGWLDRNMGQTMEEVIDRYKV